MNLLSTLTINDINLFLIIIYFTLFNFKIILRAKGIRDVHNSKNIIFVSSRTLVDISPLPKAHQAKVLKKVRDIDKSKILDLSQKIEGIKEELLYLQGLF